MFNSQTLSHQVTFKRKSMLNFRDREQRKENLIAHNLVEPSPGYDTKKADTASFKEVLHSINIELEPEIDIKLLRRVGDGDG